MNPDTPLRSERRQLYRKIVYIYFGLFAMALAERFSINVAYGAALYLSLAALQRMHSYIIRTKYDARRGKVLQAITVVFFVLATIYIVVLYPLLYQPSNAALAMAIILLPFIGRGLEIALLHRRHATLSKRAILCRILPVYVLTVVSAALLALPAGSGAAIFTAGGMLLGMALCVPLNLFFRDFEVIIQPDTQSTTSIRTIRSVRLFDGMTITAGVALNIFAFTYIVFLMFSRTHDVFWDFFVSFMIVASAIFTAYLAVRRARRSAVMQKVGKNAVYILGTAIAIFAAYGLRDSWFGTTLDISIQTLVLLLGLVLQITGTFGLQDDMLLLVRLLYKADVDEDTMRNRAQRLDVWTSIISEAIFLIMLLALISSPLFPASGVDNYIIYAPAIGSSLAAIPTVLLFASLWLSVRQPLTDKYSRRLKTYASIRDKGRDNPAMEKRLRSILVQKYKKRIGVHIIRALLRPVMHHTVTGKENVKDLPGIFVFNHREVYGPIAAVVFLPYDVRPWILYQMIEKSEITRHMYEGTFSRLKWMPPTLRKLLPKVLSPIIVWALGSFDPIPVYRGAQVSVIRTFTLSIECLAAGDSILLFPENPKHTYEKKVSDFYAGFANLGKLYYKKTGEQLVFYPVYASMKKRELRIGEGVRFDPAGGVHERGRIVAMLEQRMRELESVDES